MAKARKKSVGHIVLHTHWDREWRYPIWKNRVDLIDMMRQLLKTLETDPDYKYFLMDGQAVILEDYLEVCPQDKARIKKAVGEGRLGIGPWYTLPDLYPVDGECLLRNLLRGIRLSNEFGGHLKAGYNSFGWGQTAQFPQIYRDFGFEFLVATKHVSKLRAPVSEFMWEGPDGTQILTSRLGSFGRSNAYFQAYLPARFGIDYVDNRYKHNWGKNGTVVHNNSPEKCHEDFFKIADKDDYHPEMIKSAFQTVWNNMKETTVPDCRIIFSGCDFSDCMPIWTRMIKDANKQFDDIEFLFSSLDAYAEDLKKRIKTDKLPVVRGEMRDGMAFESSGNALATRNYIKMLNKKAQNIILRKTEPLAAMMMMAGAEYPESMLKLAWKYMLQCHAHDSINGVTQDKTADDVYNRLQQAVEIGEVLHDKSIGELTKNLNLSAFKEEDVLLLVVNPLPQPMRGVTKFAVCTPREKAMFDIAIKDAKGNNYNVQAISRKEENAPVQELAARPWAYQHDRSTVYADLGEIPAGGYKVFKVEPVWSFFDRCEWWPKQTPSDGKEISQEPTTMENEFLHVSVEADGTITLKDKTTKKTFSGLHVIEDTGDVGDYWTTYYPYDNQTHTSRGCPIRIWREENGSLGATIGIEITMKLPAFGYKPDYMWHGESKRSEETRDLVITSRVTLKRGARRLDIKTSLKNNIEDHRLRILFPTDIKAKQSNAAGHFTVDKRSVDPVRDKDGTFCPQMQTFPQQQFVDVNDGKSGFAILNNCLTEYEVLRDERLTLAITLFRSVRNRLVTDFRAGGYFPMQRGGQSLREMEFEYSLYPHAGTWEEANVYAAGAGDQCYAGGLPDQF